MTTLEAIDASIEKWEENANVSDLSEAKLAPQDCPLCMKFNRLCNKEIEPWDTCKGCPIAEYTGYPHCDETPYDEASVAESEEDLEVFREASREEVSFLKKVRQDYLDSQADSE